MIGRTRTNLRAEIEDQYDILAFLVSDISSHYQEQVDDVEAKTAEYRRANTNEDYEVVSSELRNYYAESEICDSRCLHARQILFCAIFAYYETMLNRIVLSYNITPCNQRDAKSMVDGICKFYFNKYKLSLEVENIEFANEYCRLLRNYFMHGSLSDERKRRTLYDYSVRFGGVRCCCEYYEIVDNSFMVKVLKTVLGILTTLDDVFWAQSKNKFVEPANESPLTASDREVYLAKNS